jgi:hypothetical protein
MSKNYLQNFVFAIFMVLLSAVLAGSESGAKAKEFKAIGPTEPGKLPEPDIWFHDIFRRDGSSFDPEEIKLIKRLTSTN